MNRQQTVTTYRCAGNACRQPATVKLEGHKHTLRLCERHAKTYESLGYKRVVG